MQENEALRKQVRIKRIHTHQNHFFCIKSFEQHKSAALILFIAPKYEQLEEKRRSVPKSVFLEFEPAERRFSQAGSKVVSTSSEENEHSDTCLQLGYVTSLHEYFSISKYSLLYIYIYAS